MYAKYVLLLLRFSGSKVNGFHGIFVFPAILIAAHFTTKLNIDLTIEDREAISTQCIKFCRCPQWDGLRL